MTKKYKTVLTIAGSDSGGGAGIQADLKAIAACGCYGTSAITAITAQNTVGVSAIHSIPIPILKKQIIAVLEDIGTDAIKIGMLHNAETVLAVANTLGAFSSKNIVLDPVMVATSGKELLSHDAITVLKEQLLPMARLITPNIPEAALLLGAPIHSQDAFPKLAQQLSMNGNVSVLLKAGHSPDETLVDVLYNAETDEVIKLPAQKIVTNNTHGTGCTLSAAIAAYLAQGYTLTEAVQKGKTYLNEAIKKGANYSIGKGHGPVHHFHNFWE